MAIPNDADNGSEESPLLTTTGDGTSKASHSITRKLTERFTWGGLSSCATNGNGAHDEVSRGSTAPSQPANAHGRIPADDKSLHGMTASEQFSGRNAAPGEVPSQSDSHDGPGPEHSDNGHPRGIVTTPSWGDPAGLEPRKATDQNVLLFRQAVGINIPDSDCDAADPEAASMDQNRKLATGIYGSILKQRRSKRIQYNVLSIFVNTFHVVQILVGASLTVLGSEAATHKTAITALGATNTILAGIFALLKGQGLPDRLHKDAIEYRRLQDWIEETDALLVSGVVGRDRKEIGLLVETAFKKYNAVQASEENNKPDSYVQQQPEATRTVGNGNATASVSGRSNIDSSRGVERVAIPARTGSTSNSNNANDADGGDGNSIVRLDLPSLH